MSRSRQEVEARLAEVGAAISSRVSSLEGEMHLPMRARILTRSTSIFGVAGAVVGGFIAWRLVRRIWRRRRRTSDIRDWAQDLAEDADRLVEDGFTVRDAIDRAAREHVAEVPDGSGGGGGLVSFFVGYALRAGINTALRSVVSSIVNGRGDSDSED